MSDDHSGEYYAALCDYLSRFSSPQRLDLIDAVLAGRTRYLTVVLEEIYLPHNANAVIRTCECLGIQDVHVVERENPFELSPTVTQGSAKWITLHRYAETAASVGECLAPLRAQGYRLAAMTLRPGSLTLEAVPVDRPLALCFGAEECGLSDAMHELVDYAVGIPMCGFTQSLNLSVSAAIALHILSARIKDEERRWQLSTEDRHRLRAQWLAASITSGTALVERFDAEWRILRSR